MKKILALLLAMIVVMGCFAGCASEPENDEQNQEQSSQPENSAPQYEVISIEKALELLKPGGVMTLCLYYGKENGFDEKDAILEYLKTVDQKNFSVLVCDFWNRRSCPPIAVLIRKE